MKTKTKILNQNENNMETGMIENEVNKNGDILCTLFLLRLAKTKCFSFTFSIFYLIQTKKKKKI